MEDWTDRGSTLPEPGVIPEARPAGIGPPIAMFARPATGNPLIIPQSRRGALIDLIVVLGAALGLLVAKDLLLMALPLHGYEAQRELAPFTVALTGFLIGLLVLGTARSRGLPLLTLGLDGRRWLADAGIGVAVAGGILGLLAAGSIYVQIFFPDLLPVLQESQESIVENLPQMDMFTILGLTALVAVYEELLFRGFLLTRLRTVTGSWWMAVLLGMVSFGLLHAYEGPVAIVVIMLLAGIFSLVFLWRRSLVAPVVAHFVFNAIQLWMVQVYYELQP